MGGNNNTYLQKIEISTLQFIIKSHIALQRRSSHLLWDMQFGFVIIIHFQSPLYISLFFCVWCRRNVWRWLCLTQLADADLLQVFKADVRDKIDVLISVLHQHLVVLTEAQMRQPLCQIRLHTHTHAHTHTHTSIGESVSKLIDKW